MAEFPKQLKRGDIVLKKLKPTFDNCKIVFDLMDKNRKFLRRWLRWIDAIKCKEDELGFLQKTSKSDNGEYTILFRGKIVGMCGFHSFSDKNKNGEIGYWLSREYNGMGIMTKSIKILESFVFGKLDWERVEIRNDTKNEKSAAIPKRLGYRLDGVLRHFGYGTGSDKNKFRDMNIWSKLKSEWEREKGQMK
ncbi:MAG: GNAT family N-acetyltransferase [Rickettsiales bacterium]|jgi:ribosomal-protein-serine acetyltransferase|nr:GNAT family N-acetyltransferase [Rickettsiales bacterium]